MNLHVLTRALSPRTMALTALVLCANTFAAADESPHSLLVLTSTNSTTGNAVVVFKVQNGLSLQKLIPTGGNGGASGNAGSLQFQGDLGAVANFGTNTVTQLVRTRDSISVGATIPLSSGCTGPDSVALRDGQLFVVGANCAESHAWPSGEVDGVVGLSDSSAGQIAAGWSWAAVTLKSGSLLQLPLSWKGSLAGTSNAVTLPSDANNTPLGAAFWGDLLGFNPAHSADSFALVNHAGEVFPIAGPAPSFPTNAPCWIAKGPGNIWYTGNSPGEAISIFFSDAEGGVFYKSIPLPGSPTDITVSHDKKWLAVIYSVDGAGYLAVFSIDAHGDLTQVASSDPIGVAAFNGVAFSE